MKNNTWEIMFIISMFNRRVQNLSPYTKEYEKYEELYAQAIRLQCSCDYGHIYTIDDFIKAVSELLLINYDGVGYFMTIDGDKADYVNCNVDWLNDNKKDYPYVIWYNK